MESRTELTTEGWDKHFWQSGKKDPLFHVRNAHPTAKKYYDKLFKEDQTGRVFVPLCGKSLDLIYFADLGQEVFGLEFSEIAVDSFFAENNLKFIKTVSPNSLFIIYKAIDKNITLYRGDFFQLTPEICGQFDVFWDRGSFVAINMDQRLQYSELMFKLMKPTSKYLLQGVLYEGSKYSGPPHYLTEDSLNETFGRKCSYKLLETRDSTPPSPNIDTDWKIIVYLLEPRLKGCL